MHARDSSFRSVAGRNSRYASVTGVRQKINLLRPFYLGIASLDLASSPLDRGILAYFLQLAF